MKSHTGQQALFSVINDKTAHAVNYDEAIKIFIAASFSKGIRLVVNILRRYLLGRRIILIIVGNIFGNISRAYTGLYRPS